jgi:hypothetical protein
VNRLREFFGFQSNVEASAPQKLKSKFNEVPTVTFTQLNDGWNADPNAPFPKVGWKGNDLILKMRPNKFQFERFANTDWIGCVFKDCTRFRVTQVNDHGYSLGQCRFSGLAPAWGEFYRIDGDTMDNLITKPWTDRCPDNETSKHFHFYLRDHSFECKAASVVHKLTGIEWMENVDFRDV